jgi:hypothetical protein
MPQSTSKKFKLGHYLPDVPRGIRSHFSRVPIPNAL